MMKSRRTVEFIHKIAEEEGLSVDTVTKIVRSQFMLVKKVIEAGDRVNFNFKTVLIMNFGKFLPANGKVKRLKTILSKHNGTVNTGEEHIDCSTSNVSDIGV